MNIEETVPVSSHPHQLVRYCHPSGYEVVSHFEVFLFLFLFFVVVVVVNLHLPNY